MRWEYLALTCQPSDTTQRDWVWTLGTKGMALSARLEALGAQGWELVAIQMQPMGAAFHVFKRALAEGQQPEPEKSPQPQV